MRLAGSYPSFRQAEAMKVLQAETHNYDGPAAWGCGPPLLWSVERREDEYVAAGRTLEELKALSG